MPTTVRCSQIVWFFIVSTALASAQQSKLSTPVLAPIPLAITSAKTIFIGNGGADGFSQEAFKKAGQANEPYNSFYAEMKDWGRYDILSGPTGADLVLEVRFNGNLPGCGPACMPQIKLVILDGNTKVALWTLTQQLKGAYRKETWQKNYEEGMTGLMNQLKTLVAQPAH